MLKVSQNGLNNPVNEKLVWSVDVGGIFSRQKKCQIFGVIHPLLFAFSLVRCMPCVVKTNGGKNK